MRRVKQLASAMVVGGLLLSSGSGMALAQSSTEGVDFSPNPDQCNQAPRSIEEVEALQEAGIPAGTAGTVATDDFELPAGEEASPEVRGGIVETIVQIIACANGGDQLASLGGVTDSLFEQLGGAGVFSIESITSLPASPVALPEASQTELLDTREFTLYEDGRAGVLVYYRVPDQLVERDPESVQIALWIFAEEDGRWLLDEIVPGLEAQLGDMATPPAG
jgi:hypothetical protein